MSSSPSLSIQEASGSRASIWSIDSASGIDVEHLASSDLKSGRHQRITSPVDQRAVRNPIARLAASIRTRCVRAFEHTMLPEGYPDSVTPDYATYQIADSIQAMCSSVVGTLSTRAVLRGAGVGDATATVLSATFSWVLQDGCSMLGRILFAAALSSDLDHDAKRYRLLADVTNDIGLMISIGSAHVPRESYLWVVCVASLFFAVTSVAGGATRSSLTAHFARRHNTADLSAKEGSQETAVGLLGMFLGMLAAAYTPQTLEATLSVVLFFVFWHLYANYRGVTSLVLEHLNENRLVICLQHFQKQKLIHHKGAASPSSSTSSAQQLPTPIEMKALEGVIFPGARIKKITIGVSLRSAVQEHSPQSLSEQVRVTKESYSNLKHRGFAVLTVDGDESRRNVVLGQRNTKMSSADESDEDARRQEMDMHKLLFRSYLECIGLTETEQDEFLKQLKQAGWKTDRFQLRVYSSRVILG